MSNAQIFRPRSKPGDAPINLEQGFYLHTGHIDEAGVDHTAKRIVFVTGRFGWILGERRETELDLFRGKFEEFSFDLLPGGDSI